MVPALEPSWNWKMTKSWTRRVVVQPVQQCQQRMQLAAHFACV